MPFLFGHRVYLWANNLASEPKFTSGKKKKKRKRQPVRAWCTDGVGQGLFGGSDWVYRVGGPSCLGVTKGFLGFHQFLRCNSRWGILGDSTREEAATQCPTRTSRITASWSIHPSPTASLEAESPIYGVSKVLAINRDKERTPC